jgi:hypothetical protein
MNIINPLTLQSRETHIAFNMQTELLIPKLFTKYKNKALKVFMEDCFKTYEKSILNHKECQSDFEFNGTSVCTTKKGWEDGLLSSEVEQVLGDKNILLLGESVARCYGYDPYLNFKQTLNNDKYTILDLAKTAMPTKNILSYTELINRIKPDKCIVMVGNNYPHFSFINSYFMEKLESLSIDSEKYVCDLYEKYFFKPLIKEFLKRIELNQSEILFVVPMGNIYSWERKQGRLIKSKVPKSFDPEQNLKEGMEKEDPILLNRAYEFPVSVEDSMPGLGLIGNSAFEKTLISSNCKYINLKNIVSSRADFIDYCHLSLLSILKLSSMIGTVLKFHPVDLCENDYSELERVGLESSFLVSMLHKQKAVIEKTERINKINSLFCGEPLFLIDEYHELLNYKHLRKILANGDPKSILNSNLEFSSLKQAQGNLLSRYIYNDFSISKISQGMSKRIFIDVYSREICFKFHADQSSRSFLNITLGQLFSETVISVYFNGRPIGTYDPYSSENEFEICLANGVNELQLSAESRVEEFDSVDLLNIDLERLHQPRLYSLYRCEIS